MTEESHACQIAFKAPPCWPENIGLWFAQLEASFEVSKIYQDATKYYCAVTALDRATLPSIADIVMTPPVTNMYETLKKRLMSKYTDSKQERIRKVINDNDMGDRKPSTFLQELKLKASGDFTEELLKNIWLQRLPVNVQSVLATKNDIELDTLAQMADRIHEVATTNINAISTKNSQAQRTAEEIEHLLSSVEVLKTKIEQISTHNYGKNRETQNDYRNPNKTPP